MLTPREDVGKFDPADRNVFGKKLWGLVAMTHEYWPTAYLGIETRDFADMAALAADVVRGQAAYERT